MVEPPVSLTLLTHWLLLVLTMASIYAVLIVGLPNSAPGSEHKAVNEAGGSLPSQRSSPGPVEMHQPSACVLASVLAVTHTWI